MKLGHNHLGRRHAFFWVNINRNTAPIIGNSDRPAFIKPDLDNIAMAGKCLINGIIDNLINHVMQARPIIRVANIHARPFANGV